MSFNIDFPFSKTFQVYTWIVFSYIMSSPDSHFVSQDAYNNNITA